MSDKPKSVWIYKNDDTWKNSDMMRVRLTPGKGAEEYIPATEATRLRSLLAEAARALEFYSWDGQVKPDDGKLADAVLDKIHAEMGKE